MWRGRTLGRLEMFFQTCCSPLCGGCSAPPAPLITLRLYSSQLRAASLDPCLSLLEVNGDREVATGAIEPIHHQSTLLWACLGLASWRGTQMSGLLYTSLQRTKEGKSHLTPCGTCKDAHQITLSLGIDV